MDMQFFHSFNNYGLILLIIHTKWWTVKNKKNILFRDTIQSKQYIAQSLILQVHIILLSPFLHAFGKCLPI